MVVFSEGKSKTSNKRVPRGVFFTVNGQVHGGLPSNYVSQQLRFDYLKEHLLVSVDCTAMDASVREDFFMASRDRVRKNEVYDEINDRLREALREHPGLNALNAVRRKNELEEHISSEEGTSSLFNELLKRDPTLAGLFNVGTQLITSLGPGEVELFKGAKFPTYFRLAKRPAKGLVKTCPVNRTCRVEFETDANNDYFRRSDSPGSISTEPPNLIEHSHLWNGQFSARFRAPWDAKPGDRIEVKVTVTDVKSEVKGGFVSTFTFVVLDEDDRPTPPSGNGSGVKTGKNGKKTAPGLANPEIKEVRKDRWEERNPPFTPYTALDVKHGDESGYDFFLNIDNTFLLTELSKAKSADQPLIKYWFKYGLVLCALGMLQEQHRRREVQSSAVHNNSVDDEKEERVEDLERIGEYCSGLARVIVPIVRALYRGPESGS